MPEKAEVIPLTLPPLSGSVKIGKVYARGEVAIDGATTWAFTVEGANGEQVGFEFGSREGAVKGRVLMRKMAKEKGIKLLS